MTKEQFESLVESIYICNYTGSEIVIFAKMKYDFEDEYESFEIIVSGSIGNIEIDWDYDEGQNDFILEGWEYLNNILDKVHNDQSYRRNV